MSRRLMRESMPLDSMRLAYLLLAMPVLACGCAIAQRDDIPSGVALASRPPLGEPVPTTPAALSDDRGSWMLPEASSENLLYVANNNATVTVYAYPQGKQVGTLRNFDVAEGECVDNAGDVFITVHDLQEVIEYAHGAKTPKATLSDAGYLPFSCSVDPTTGNLAVVNDSSASFGPGALAVYTKGQGKPTIYKASNSDFLFCAYDNQENLFINANFSQLDELPKGGKTLKTITLNVSNLYGGVQWDGKYLAVGDGDPIAQKLYRFNISGSEGTKEGSTTLRGGDTELFWIYGAQIVGLHDQANIGLWSYPKGGNAIKTFYHDVSYPTGVTISPASPRKGIQ